MFAGGQVRITLRDAGSADVDTLAAWDREPHVIFCTGSDADEETDWAEELAQLGPWGRVLIAELHDGPMPRPIACVQIINPAAEPTHYWGATARHESRAIDIWIGPAGELGRGHGTEIMRQVIDSCFADPAVEEIVIDPLEINTRARKFYERLGFVEVGPRKFGDDQCVVYRLGRP